MTEDQMRRLLYMQKAKTMRNMDRFRYEDVIFEGHPVRIVHKYPHEQDLYFDCTTCGTRYIVPEHDTYTKMLSLHERASNLHKCPVCRTENSGRSTPVGYRDTTFVFCDE